jgi:hypothetical protein
MNCKTKHKQTLHSAGLKKLLKFSVVMHILTIYAPMIYTASCIIFWMRAYPLQGEVGGGWALEFKSFLGPVKYIQLIVPFDAYRLF